VRRRRGLLFATWTTLSSSRRGDPFCMPWHLRRFERFSLLLVFGSLLLVAVFSGFSHHCHTSVTTWWYRSCRRTANCAR
jgi:hypothetical protein